MPAIVKSTHLVFNGKKYFRAGAEDVVIGSWGEKKSPITAQNYLFVKGDLTPKKMRLRAKQATIVEIDFKKSSKGNFSVKGGAPVKGVNFNGEMGGMYDSLKSGKLKLVKLRVLPSDMEDAVNGAKKVLEKMKHDGKKARIANEIFVVIEAKLAKKLTTGLNGKFSGGRGKVEVSVDGKTSTTRETSVTLSKGTTFAYMLLEPEWDHKSKAKRTKIIDWEDDQWGSA